MSSSVHSSLCEEYDIDRIRPQVKEHLDLYEKFKDLSGKKVLLKINLLSATEPDKAVTTHPVFLKAIVMEVQDRGGKVLIADSPGGPFNKGTLKKAYEATGVMKVAEETGAELNYDTDSHVEKHIDGRFIKSFNICNYIDSCDLTIAVPKIKTHMFCGFTCASKIMFGAIPGIEKVRYHTRFPDPIDFSKMLLDLTDLCKVDLFMVDGIIGMEGNGPNRGIPVKVGRIVSGEDHVSIDQMIVQMVGLDSVLLPIMEAAYGQNLIGRDEDPISSGSAGSSKLDRPFIPPKGSTFSTDPPGYLKRIVRELSSEKPRISYNTCIGCGVCKLNCAGDAIEIRKGKAHIKYSKCIRCYCCHELCPHDSIYVTIKEGGIGQWIRDLGARVFS